MTINTSTTAGLYYIAAVLALWIFGCYLGAAACYYFLGA
jgi:hypothetical protein